MDAEPHAAARRRARDQADRLLIQRLYACWWLAAAALPAYAAFDYYSAQPHFYSLQVIKVGALLFTLAWLRWCGRPAARRHARGVGLLLVVVGAAGSGASAALSGDHIAHGFFCIMLPLITAVLLPWGPRVQTAAVGMIAATAVAATYAVAGALTPLVGYPAVFALSTWLVSVYIAHALEGSRLALARQDIEREAVEIELRDEVQVSTALARIGEELIASDRGVLLERLCESTAEVLECDCSWTVMKAGDGGSFVIAARHGFPEEVAGALDVLEIPRPVMQTLLDALASGSAPRAGTEGGATPLARMFGVQRWLAIPLQWGDEIIGVHGAGFLRPGQAFTREHRRILSGIAHLASLALRNSRLVTDLEGALQVKSLFVANMSHELRTPLNVILGYNALILDGTFGPLRSEQADALGRADRNARELLDLIGTTLDLSRLDGGRVPLSPVECDVDAVLRDLARELEAMPAAPAGGIHWQVEPGLPPLRTDLLKLRMVLKNLVHNACKFGGQEPIRVAARTRAGGIEFAVSDRGPGIAAAERDRIFEPFHQSAAAGDKGGLGLGLYIVRRLLDLLGGRIAVDSSAGQGATFTAWLPLAAGEVDADDEAPPLPGTRPASSGRTYH